MNAQQTQAQTVNASRQSATPSAPVSAKGFRKFVLLGLLFVVGTLDATALLSLANTSAIAAQWVSAPAAKASETSVRRVNANVGNGVPVHAFRSR